MLSIQFLSIALFFLLGTFFLTAVNNAMRHLHKRDIKLKALGKRFFYRYFHLLFFPRREHEGLFFATICAQNITRFCYAAAIALFLIVIRFHGASWVWLTSSAVGFILFAFFVGDYLPRFIGSRFPEGTIRLCSFFASIFLLIAFPMTYIFLKLTRLLPEAAHFDQLEEMPHQGKKEIIDMIQEADVGEGFDQHDKKLFESALTFNERIAREIMVPRVDLFSLPANTSIKEATNLLKEEGFSRIPVYRNTVDNITGVLMHKDLVSKYMEYEQANHDPKIIEAPIESIQKSALYVPETKKISALLQEFRKKQVHIAIVVDEYGGTEGIVTIEDILEEIVGEIADEYDEEEELYVPQSDDSWIVDARLSILDTEEQLGIKIPQEGDYDTIGGYIFHCAGTIPTKGFLIHSDTFEIEVLRSDDRRVEKVRIRIFTKEETKPGQEQESTP